MEFGNFHSMTDIHLLLYRLAELMLDQEQHILPVDLLFDDAQLGDFVKSIAIDSPYQQMLLEGVLTESVREEKLLVSFTVEGYFHHVLGEVLSSQYNELGMEDILVKLNKSEWTHLPVGISLMLVNLVQNGEYLFLIRALEEQVDVKILIPSIAQVLVIGKQTDFIYRIDVPEFWSKVLNAMLDKTNYNVIGEVLTQLPASLSLKLLNDRIARQLPADILREIKEGGSDSGSVQNYFLDFYLGNYQQVLENYKTSNTSHLTESEWLCIISTLIDTGNFDDAVHLLKSDHISDAHAIEKLRLLAIGYHGAKHHQLAKTAIDGAISQSLFKFGSYHFKTAELLNLSGLLSLANEEFKRAESDITRALSVFEKSKGNSNFEFVSSTGNLALVAYHSGRLKEAIRIWMDVIQLLSNIGMEYHPETALVQKNLAFAYIELKNPQQAEYFAQKALQIFNTSGMQQTSSYRDCENILKNLGAE